MNERERMLAKLGELLEQVARPYHSDSLLPAYVQTALWQLGFPCSERTPREELIPQLWARKRGLLSAIGSEWSGSSTPPSAA